MVTLFILKSNEIYTLDDILGSDQIARDLFAKFMFMRYEDVLCNNNAERTAVIK